MMKGKFWRVRGNPVGGGVGEALRIAFGEPYDTPEVARMQQLVDQLKQMEGRSDAKS